MYEDLIKEHKDLIKGYSEYTIDRNKDEFCYGRVHAAHDLPPQSAHPDYMHGYGTFMREIKQMEAANA